MPASSRAAVLVSMRAGSNPFGPTKWTALTALVAALAVWKANPAAYMSGGERNVNNMDAAVGADNKPSRVAAHVPHNDVFQVDWSARNPTVTFDALP